MFTKTLNYRIENLELVLRNINEDSYSPKQEIIKWEKETAKSDSERDEYCYSIALFKYDGDGYPELRYVGDRPIGLTPGEQLIFMELVKEGYKYKISQFKDNYAESIYEKYI